MCCTRLIATRVTIKLGSLSLYIVIFLHTTLVKKNHIFAIRKYINILRNESIMNNVRSRVCQKKMFDQECYKSVLLPGILYGYYILSKSTFSLISPKLLKNTYIIFFAVNIFLIIDTYSSCVIII